jgi:hypothetical protein
MYEEEKGGAQPRNDEHFAGEEPTHPCVDFLMLFLQLRSVQSPFEIAGSKSVSHSCFLISLFWPPISGEHTPPILISSFVLFVDIYWIEINFILIQ